MKNLPAGFGVLLVACSAPPEPGPARPAAAELSPAEFPGAAALLSGFDERRDDVRWSTGDEVLFGLRLRKGASTQHWLLHLRVVLGQTLVDAVRAHDPEADIVVLWNEQTWTYTLTRDADRRDLQVKSLMLPVSVVVADGNGRKLGACVVKLPAQLLGHGVLPAVERGLAQARAEAAATPLTYDEAHVRPMVEALVGMMSLLNVVQTDDVLADYFWQVVQKPSIWSVVTSLGVAATLRMPFEQSAPAAGLPPHLPSPGPAFTVPLQVDVNDTPALLAEVVATDARRPYSLCGGMVAARAHHPTDPDLQFDVQLLAARLGTERQRTIREGPDRK